MKFGGVCSGAGVPGTNGSPCTRYKSFSMYQVQPNKEKPKKYPAPCSLHVPGYKELILITFIVGFLVFKRGFILIDDRCDPK